MKKQYKLIIVIILLALLTALYIKSTTPRERTVNTEVNDISSPSFQLKLNKNQTNELINFYLKDFQKDSKIKYEFILENLALLKGEIEVLGKNVNLYFYFRPVVLEDGDVELKIESISVGTLELPSSEILKYIAANYKIPSWVEIDSKQEKIELNLSKFKLKSGIYASASKIDLINDAIELNIFIPKK